MPLEPPSTCTSGVWKPMAQSCTPSLPLLPKPAYLTRFLFGCTLQEKLRHWMTSKEEQQSVPARIGRHTPATQGHAMQVCLLFTMLVMVSHNIPGKSSVILPS